MLKSSLFQDKPRLGIRPPAFGPKPPSTLPRSLFVASDRGRLTLAEFNQRFRQIPEQTAALGVCEDGLPVLLNLNDRRGGPLLVTGDEGCGKTMLLKILVQSALAHDPEQRVLFTVVASQKEDYFEIEQSGLETGQCLGVYEPEDEILETHLQQVVGLIEKRVQRKQAAPPLLVVVDGLEFLITARGEIRNLVELLLRSGMEAKIWLVAALRTADCLEMGRWTRHFRTRLIGHMPNQAARRLSLFGGLDAEKLQAQQEFATLAAGKWLIFRTPDATAGNDVGTENTLPETEEDTGEDDENWDVVVR
ncbi:MAG: NACHT domain-containing protein [Anaerolineae bacterium]|nr:NACHT domain-containing protein [Anaerolineae bacterium]